MYKITKHIPVMTTEIISNLELKSDGTYVDATLGSGGHSFELIKKTLKQNILGVKLITIDLDTKAWEKFQNRLRYAKIDFDTLDTKENTIRIADKIEVKFYQTNFKKIDSIVPDNQISAIIADLGLTQDQIDSDLGLSYHKKYHSELDMRLDKTLGVKAKDLLNLLGKKELTKMFSEYGDIKYSKKLVDVILTTRESKKISTNGDLTRIVKAVVKDKTRLNKELAKIYQALRIAVNTEYANLKVLLEDGYEKLTKGGKFLIISFHSGEEKIIDSFIKGIKDQKNCNYKVIPASPEETKKNPRARSAKLHLIEKH